MKERSDLICGKAAVGGNNNSTRDTLGIDIPEKYPSLVVGNEATSVKVANEINNIIQFSNVNFRECWPTNMECNNSDSIDQVFSEYVFEHIPDLESAINEMY